MKHLVAQAINNAWSNHRLLGACARLSDEAFAAPRTSFFPSIQATCNHILTNDWYYLDAMERAVRGQPFHPTPWQFHEPEVPFPTCAPLAVAQRASDRRLVDLCRGVDDAHLALPVAIQRIAGLVHEPLERVLFHLFQHQIHHRGQAHAMLAGTDVAPPQLDEYFLLEDAPRRAAELAELGYEG